MLTFWSRRLRHGDEAGSTMMIAIMVMMILSTLSLGVLARTLSVMSLVRNGQDYDAALAVADAGLADAVHALDVAGDTSPATWTRSGTSGAGQWTYRATKVDAKQYQVRVLGRLGRSSHGVQALVTRGAKYPFALFANRSLDLSSSGIKLGLSSWLTLGQPDTGQVNIGTNGQMVVSPGSDAGDFQHIYPPEGSCSGCNPATLVTHDTDEGAYPLPDVTKPSASTPTQACPLLGTFTGLVDGKNGRPFVCEKDTVLSGVIGVINPPFVLYVLPNATTGAPSSLDLRTAVVNAGQRADNVEIKKAGSGPLLLDTANTPAQLTFSGILYAPQSKLKLQGSKWWSGSVTVNDVEPVQTLLGGTPVLTIGYDLNLGSNAFSSWRVGRYSQIPSAQTGLT